MPSPVINAVHVNSFNLYTCPVRRYWGCPLFARWKDWDTERLVSLLFIFFISSSNSTCWQKLHSKLILGIFSYFYFKTNSGVLAPLFFPWVFFKLLGLMQPHDIWRKLLVPCCHHLPYTGFCWDVQPRLVLSSDGWPSRPVFSEGAGFTSCS